MEFIFETNEYFTNGSLTKDYVYRFAVDETNVLTYEGPEIVKCTGYVGSLFNCQTYFADY